MERSKKKLADIRSVKNYVHNRKDKHPRLSTKPTTKVVIFRSKQLLFRSEFKSYEWQHKKDHEKAENL